MIIIELGFVFFVVDERFLDNVVIYWKKDGKKEKVLEVKQERYINTVLKKLGFVNDYSTLSLGAKK